MRSRVPGLVMLGSPARAAIAIAAGHMAAPALAPLQRLALPLRALQLRLQALRPARRRRVGHLHHPLHHPHLGGRRGRWRRLPRQGQRLRGMWRAACRSMQSRLATEAPGEVVSAVQQPKEGATAAALPPPCRTSSVLRAFLRWRACLRLPASSSRTSLTLSCSSCACCRALSSSPCGDGGQAGRPARVGRCIARRLPAPARGSHNQSPQSSSHQQPPPPTLAAQPSAASRSWTCSR